MKKHKLFMFIVSLMMVVGMLLSACQPAATEEPTVVEDGEETIKVVNLINGVLGDKSFFDSADRGMQRVMEDYPQVEVKTIEAGVDPAKWQAALEDAAANEDYDVMILGTYQMSEFLEMVAPQYPDKKFIIYDVSVDYSKEGLDNVYSVTYKQNEGSYMAGVYVGLMSESGIVGVVGGQDIPVINDFIAGYEQGAKAYGVENVIVQYAGGWNDPAKGKELALAMYQQGADYVFQVAGGTGVGVFQAAQELEQFAIGVDSDQALIIAETNPEQAEFIPTSMLKNVDNSLYRAMKLYIEGTLPFGEAEALGVAEGGVGLAKNEYYDKMTPDDVKAKIEEVEQMLIDGEIVVDTVFE
jgi:basic membrane protein A and related proteins